MTNLWNKTSVMNSIPLFHSLNNAPKSLHLTIADTQTGYRAVRRTAFMELISFRHHAQFTLHTQTHTGSFPRAARTLWIFWVPVNPLLWLYPFEGSNNT